MIGTLILGTLALQTVLVIGGSQDASKSTYDPVLHISHVGKAAAKGGVRILRRIPATKAKEAASRLATRSKVRILDASAGKEKQALVDRQIPASVSITRTGDQLSRNLSSPRQRQIVLPLLRQLEKADWHLARGARQGRTNLRAQTELSLAIQMYQRTNRLAIDALRREGRESPLSRRLVQVRSLATQGTISSSLAMTRLQLENHAFRGAELSISIASRISPADPQVLVLKTKVDQLLGRQ